MSQPCERILDANGSHEKNYANAILLPDAKVGFCAMVNSSRPRSMVKQRGNSAVDKLNEHFKAMWYNENVLTFFDEASASGVTASSTSSDQKYVLDNLTDTDMLTTWRAGAPGSSLQLKISKPLAHIRGLILIYPRGQHNIEDLKIFASVNNGAEALVYTGNVTGNDNSVFEVDGAFGVNTLRVEFINKPGKSTEVAEMLLLYDDPLGRMKNKFKGIRAVDKD